MTSWKIIALVLALGVAGACGKKTKPEATGPTTERIDASKNGNGDQAGNDGAGTGGEGTGSGPNASLGEIIYFEFDSSELDEAARQTLNQNAEWLQEDPARTLRIEGHTDETGTNEYNLALGQRRAESVKAYLMRLGIAADRIDTITFGEEKPASPEDAKNRRSVFVATKK